jgi:hypothetical protein
MVGRGRGRVSSCDSPARPLQIASASDLLLGTEFECNRIVAMDPSSAAARIG